MDIYPKAVQLTNDGIIFFAKYQVKLLEIAQRLAEYCQIGEISLNLVTLQITIESQMLVHCWGWEA